MSIDDYFVDEPVVTEFLLLVNPLPPNKIPYFDKLDPLIDFHQITLPWPDSQDPTAWEYTLPPMYDGDDDPLTYAVDFGEAATFMSFTRLDVQTL